MPIAMVSRPVRRKMIFQGAIEEPWRAAPLAMPYATRPPKICAQPLKLNQIPVRNPCSRFVYHWLVIRAKPGVTAASKTPRKKRTATAPEKSLTAAKQQRVVPQRMMLTALYLPKGSHWRRRLVGYSHAKFRVSRRWSMNG